MNTNPNTDKPTKSNTTTFKRAPLTKAYSCSDASPSNLIGDCTFITPQQFELIFQQSNGSRLPVLDCRSQMDYGCERIQSSYNVNCRTKIMARKLTSKPLENIEPNLSLLLHNSDTVILYDQSMDIRGQEKLRSLPINLVVQAAYKSNKKVYIIQGGFDAVKAKYPHLIEYPTETFKEKYEQDLIISPTTPTSIDKENFVMTEVLPQIFVGNNCDAQNRDRLTQNGITHIINCTPDLPFYWENLYEYIRVDALDLPSQNIRKYFGIVIEFIDNALRSKKNNILVHCSAGVSRSPTLVLAYMMKKNHWTLEEAFDRMRKLRQIVDPNVSFIIQLREWEKTIQSSLSTSSSTTDTSDDSSVASNSNNVRSTPNTYCGSTSKNKTDPKARTDSVITVN